MNLFDAFERYKNRRLIGCSKNTEGKFRRAIRNLGILVGHLPTTDDLTDDNIADLLATVLAKGRTPDTANDYRNKLVALWTFCARRRWVDTFPDIRQLDMPEHAPVAWTRDELPKVFAATELAYQPICGIPGPLWFRLFVSLLWDTGERSGAILLARREHVIGDTLFVPAANRKGKTRDKIYTLHSDTLELIRERDIYTQRDELLPKDFNRATIYNRWRSCLKRAGLPHDSKHMFHCFRRSVASHAKAAGADATDLLDHSSSAITKASYLDPRIVPAPKAVDVLFRPV